MNLEITNRYVYVVSDIHNEASGFKELLDKFAFSKEDLLIINGYKSYNCEGYLAAFRLNDMKEFYV